jgi:predicted lipoprotein with Yx(FWY)xxD motif
MTSLLHRRFRTLLAPGLLLALASIFALAGCGASGGGGLYGSSGNNSNTGSSSGSTTCADSSASICTRSAVQVGSKNESVLANPGGMTLYYFSADSATSVACTGACTSTWHPLLTSSSSLAPISGLTGALATVDRGDGTQLTYNGHPLYTYVGDSAPGDAKGEGIGGKWFAATPDLAPGGSDSGYGY